MLTLDVRLSFLIKSKWKEDFHFSVISSFLQTEYSKIIDSIDFDYVAAIRHSTEQCVSQVCLEGGPVNLLGLICGITDPSQGDKTQYLESRTLVEFYK